MPYNKNMKTTAKIGTSKYGNNQVEIEIDNRGELGLTMNKEYRKLRAALHKIAAAVELATPDNEGWCVTVEDTRVVLELIEASTAEAKRALVVAQSVRI